MNRQRMMQSRFETIAGSEDECDIRPPPFKRRKLSPDPAAFPHADTSYEHTNTHGNARAHYGHVFNNYVAQDHRSNTAPPMLPPVFQDHQNSGLGATQLIRVLCFDHMNSRFDTMHPALEGTCEWLFEREEYKAWRDPNKVSTHHGFLWIKGKPGTGKSTLMRSAYIHGVDTFADDIIVSYFFGSHVTKLQSSAEGLYRSVLCRLLETQPELSASLQKLGLHLDREHSVWNNELLKFLLRKAVLALDTKRLTCYVDAVDECGYSEAQDVVDFFKVLREVAHKAGIEVRVLLSSRHYPQVDLRCCSKIILEDEIKHQIDLSRYVESELRIGESSQARKIRSIIQQRASGVFLWVVLIVQILNQDKLRGRVHQMEKRLNALPDGLHQLFESIVQSGPYDGDTLLLALQWVLFANRPLLREDLYSALIANDSEGEIPAWDHDEVGATDMENFIVDSSRGLIEVVKGAHPTVRFIHGSVRDYLLATGLSSLCPSSTTNIRALCQDRLKECCYQYISRSSPAALAFFKERARGSMSQCSLKSDAFQAHVKDSHPFLDYALDGMLSHANAAHLLGLRQDDFIRTFPLKRWLRLHNALAQDWTDRLSPVASREYVFVIKNAFGLTEYANSRAVCLSNDGCTVSEEECLPLLYTTLTTNYHATTELLLERGAGPGDSVTSGRDYVNAFNTQGNTGPRRKRKRHDEAVQRSSFGLHDMKLSLLRRAAESALTDIVGILLAHPEYAIPWDPDMDFVLEAAIYTGDSAQIQQFHGILDPGTMNKAPHGPVITTDQQKVGCKSLYSLKIYHQSLDGRRPPFLCLLYRIYNHFRNAYCHLPKAKPRSRILNRNVTTPAPLCMQLPKASYRLPQGLRQTRAADRLPMYPIFKASMNTIAWFLVLLERSAPRLQAQVQPHRSMIQHMYSSPAFGAVITSSLFGRCPWLRDSSTSRLCKNYTSSKHNGHPIA
jgi:hypothetical protein